MTCGTKNSNALGWVKALWPLQKARTQLSSKKPRFVVERSKFLRNKYNVVDALQNKVLHMGLDCRVVAATLATTFQSVYDMGAEEAGRQE